jgi:hypothetical protein
MDQNSNQNKRRIIFRLIRIALIAFVLLLLTIVMNPKRFLPPDMSVGEFFQALTKPLRMARQIVGSVVTLVLAGIPNFLIFAG